MAAAGLPAAVSPPGEAAGPGALPRRAAAVSVPVHEVLEGEKHSLRGGEAVESDVGSEQHTLNVTRDITRSIEDLESDIVELEKMSESTGKRGHIEVLKVKKMALANLLEGRVQGALVRSRYQNIAEMDAPSGFFFGLEKKNGQRKVIHSLLSDAGQGAHGTRARSEGGLSNSIPHFTPRSTKSRPHCRRSSSGFCGDQLQARGTAADAGASGRPAEHAGTEGSGCGRPNGGVF
ncbi:hypothetical protein L3Q82_000113 [Scortum barcoo]|uniref:Uncharacterized protein n=1 Tax=Scortum barcoo TaxID=214431 RepID=A0ACB8X977_9TELE|nr:hypothetical protein L3Q82_000113 [Scortum barcoo]